MPKGWCSSLNYKRLLELISNYLDEGIIVTDTDANITYYKESATNIGGIGAENANGKNILEVFPKLTPETSTFYHVLKTRKPLIDHIQHYVNYAGRKVSTVTSTLPIIENGKLVGAFEIFKDLTRFIELSEKIVSLQAELYNKKNSKKNISTSGAKYSLDDIVGKSDAIVKLKEKVLRIADSISPVMVYGETGTGKELLIQAIHNAGSRRNRPFIAQNCAALPQSLLESLLFGTMAGSFTGATDRPGLFELADGGTLFLDEINSMELELQAKLLRVIQDGVVRRVGGIGTKAVDVRIIASTNEPPAKLLAEKRLRQDLYYRLNTILLTIPPLRERREDIGLLLEHFIENFNERLKRDIKGVTREVMDSFLEYEWPGNVRELEHMIESAVNFIDGDTIGMEDLHFGSESEAMGMIEKTKENGRAFQNGLDEALKRYERQLINEAVKASGGNYSEAARLLKLPKQTLHNKLKKYGINTQKTDKK